MSFHTRFLQYSARDPWIALIIGLCAAVPVSLAFNAQPASAQITVFDPTNYSQNILTAARSLQQVNNQIRSLQNQATMLVNQAKNLSTINFPELQALTARLQQIDQLMGQAQGIQFRIASTDQQFRALFPGASGLALTSSAQLADARARMAASVAAFRQAMSVQSQIVENVQADASSLGGIVSRSQGAEGALQVSQATNQLLALTAKQQFQIQNLMAAQYRAEAIEQARRVQAESDAHAATTRFLGSGTAYTPH
jgi:P-type conjugative transfer protein TrbJ